MQSLSQLLYVISTTLLVPVMATVLLLSVWTLVLLGGFLREWAGRKGVRKLLGEAVRVKPTEAAWEILERMKEGIPRRYLDRVGSQRNDKRHRDQALEDVDHRIAAALARLSFITRIGPMLGLMGTLIPLGPGLMGLAGGDMAELSSNLIVAFTTTVVGLLVSSLAYGMGLLRRLWYAQDMGDLQACIDRLPGATAS